jgi:hypothetical protein
LNEDDKAEIAAICSDLQVIVTGRPKLQRGLVHPGSKLCVSPSTIGSYSMPSDTTLPYGTLGAFFKADNDHFAITALHVLLPPDTEKLGYVWQFDSTATLENSQHRVKEYLNLLGPLRATANYGKSVLVLSLFAYCIDMDIAILKCVPSDQSVPQCCIAHTVDSIGHSEGTAHSTEDLSEEWSDYYSDSDSPESNSEVHSTNGPSPPVPYYVEGCTKPKCTSNFSAVADAGCDIIFKHGAATGLTSGKLTTASKGSQGLIHRNGTRLLEVNWTGEPFSKPGDSGALYYSSPDVHVRPLAIHVFGPESEDHPQKSNGVALVDILAFFRGSLFA